MSTNNQPKQTLFRFVSLRAPQQSNEEGQDKRFALAPLELKQEHFYQYVLANPSVSRQQALLDYARTYETTPSNIFDREQLKTHSIELYNLAIWIARNKGNYSDVDLMSKIDEARNNFDPNLETDFILKLWNNLIYQVTIQKDFYVKETIMQLLLAIHTIQFHGTEEENKILINARIVLPKELMLGNDEIGSNFQMVSRPAAPTPAFASEDMKKVQAFSLANMQLRGLENLRKDLSKMQKAYEKEYQAEYKRQELAYQEEVQPTIDQYNQDVEDAKTAYCEVRDPNIEYNPNDPCQQPREVAYPVLPKFEFSFSDEVDLTSLSESLDSHNFETLLGALGYEVPLDFDIQNLTENQLTDIQKAMEGINTFHDVENVISESKENAQKQISENIISNESVYKSIGGVMVSVSRAALVTKYFSICPINLGRWTNFNLQLNLPDATWDVAGISYTLTETTNNVSYPTSNYYVKTKVDNIVYLNNLMASAITSGQLLLDLPHSLNIQVTFINGQTTEFTAVFENIKLCDRGNFEIVGDENGSAEIIIDENNFIPSGFGFKQIGIADYLKVEQTTHAYVPGDVAHIENVMAREYRQKSSRRLRRSENTTTTSNDTEREKLTDTTTATRFEMQSEIAKMQAEAKDISAYANASYTYGEQTKTGVFNINAGANFAHHQSKEESTRQAMTQAQDVTERAMDRIVTKVHEERIEKIIEEFEENNAHGLDNREGDKHVVGVFRWVDKLMKNQIYNYGKRMMFEFMIPEPAKLHDLGMTVDEKPSDVVLTKPEDPRTASSLRMENYSALSNEAILKHWISKYNVDIDDKPAESKKVSFSFSDRNIGQDVNDVYGRWTGVYNKDLEIEVGYCATYVTGTINVGVGAGTGMHPSSRVYICGIETAGNVNRTLNNVEKAITISSMFWDIRAISGSLVASLSLTQEAKNAWYQKAFNAIIDAYETALTEYNEKVSAEQNKAVVISGSNPAFYRQIENTVLRKNCISYMADRTANSTRGYGLSGLTQGGTFTDYETVLSPTLDKYTAFVKFMEQAFEWENLSYYLYPYYWGSKTNWATLYQQEDVDPLFRAFLQSGMARVIVTVRPGFEDAVQFYMATGKIWNGGEVPVIGDELYLSIVDEMKEPKGVKQGKAWINRLPTPLTILQAQNIGLTVQQALPFSSENPDDFEIPEEVITQSSFSISTSQLEGASQLKGVSQIYTDGDNLILANEEGNTLASMTISELVNAEKQMDNMTIRDERLVLRYKEEEIASIPLQDLREAMGI